MTFRAVKTSLRKQHDKAIRQGLRHRRTEIRAAIKEAKKNERLTLAKVREQCRRSRARVAERVAKLRDETRRAVNAEADLLRASAKGACSSARARAKRQTRERLQQLERAEREAKTDILREKNFSGYVKRAEKRRLPDRHVETDEEVADNLAAELRPVWHEMRQAFKPEPRRSRTEAFLEWAEANPDEVLALQVELGEQATEALLDAQEEQQAEVERLLEQRDLSLADLASLGISRETVSEAGYDPDNPAHLRAFLTGQEPPPEARQRPAAQKPRRQRQSDAEKIRDAVARMGVGLKEPEAAAMLDWSEERAWKAAKAALRAKLLERVNGELVLPGPERAADDGAPGPILRAAVVPGAQHIRARAARPEP